MLHILLKKDICCHVNADIDRHNKSSIDVSGFHTILLIDSRAESWSKHSLLTDSRAESWREHVSYDILTRLGF